VVDDGCDERGRRHDRALLREGGRAVVVEHGARPVVVAVELLRPKMSHGPQSR
jgi:hypothetical protein